MILFGRKAHHLKLQEDSSQNCSKCGSQRTAISLFQKYFHVFWMPVFPIKKEAASQCLNCKQVLVEKKFPAAHLQIAQALKRGVKTPFWTFIGGFLLVLGLLLKMILR